MVKSIYVIFCAGFYKVGIASDMKKRLTDIQNQNPLPVHLINEYPGVEFAGRKEREIHRRLSEFRHWGEWFSCDVESIQKTIETVLDTFKGPTDDFRKDQLKRLPDYRRKGGGVVETNNGRFILTGERRRPVTGEWYLFSAKKALAFRAAENHYYPNRYLILKKI